MINKKGIFLVIIFSVVVNLFSEDAISYYKKARESYFYENYNETINYLLESLKINPDYLDALELISRVYYDSGNYEYAFNNLNRAIVLAPQRSDLVIFLSDVECALKRYDLAEDRYKRIIDNDPLNMDAFNGLANLYLITGRKILARDTLLGILKSDNKNFKAILKLSEYYESTDVKKAEDFYIKNITFNSLNPEGYFKYSMFLFKNGRVKNALENINIAIKIKDNTVYKKVKGRYLLHLGLSDEALSIFKDVVSLAGKDHIIYYYLANAYYMLSDYDLAVSSLMKGIAIRSDDEISSLFLDRILVEKYSVGSKERIKRALFYYQRSVDAKRSSFFDLYLFSLRRAILLDPKNSKMRLELAEYYKGNKFPERYFREISIIQEYSADENIKNMIEMESRNKSYRLGNDWGINQYNVENDIYLIPLFASFNISNIHYKIEDVFGGLLANLSYEKYKYELVPMIEREFTTTEKMSYSQGSGSPFYFDLEISEGTNSIAVTLFLKNSINSQLIRKFGTYQIGNDRMVITGASILSKIDQYIPFRAGIIKISGDRALINAGRKSGVKLKDTFYILNKRVYPLQPGKTDYLYEKSDIKGTGVAVKVDENIAELKFKDNDFFKDIDVNDLIVYIDDFQIKQ